MTQMKRINGNENCLDQSNPCYPCAIVFVIRY